jgi:hypothetical protein
MVIRGRSHQLIGLAYPIGLAVYDSLWQTERFLWGSYIAKRLLLSELRAELLLDTGCGDFSWMSRTDLLTVSYTDVDINRAYRKKREDLRLSI